MMERIVLLAALATSADVSADVQKSLDARGRASVLFLLPPLDLSTRKTAISDSDAEKLVSDLQQHAKKRQARLLDMCKSHQGCDVTHSYWISNTVAAEVSSDAIAQMSGFTEIDRIVTNDGWKVELETPETETNVNKSKSTNEPEWNVEWIKSNYLYAKGFKGKGMVIGNADTGIDHTHPALVQSYRGTLQSRKHLQRYSHHYNWFDATQIGPLPVQVNATDSSCRQGVRHPCDDHGHGTHTVGTSAGTLEGIGVAPEAKWIGCRNMFAGYGTPATYLGCLEWMVAPTRLDGSHMEASKRPHAIGNSYGCPTNEGCSADTFRGAVQAVRKAGIFMAVSAGNNGRDGCGTVTAPPGLDANVCSVGALAHKSNAIADYSSRGPVTVDGSGRRKPDIVAPGSSVRSAWPPAGYNTISGTSMAAPAVAGAVALLWEAMPALARDIDTTERVLYESASPLYDTADKCGADTASTLPNQIYGHGLLDLEAAYNHALKLTSQ